MYENEDYFELTIKINSFAKRLTRLQNEFLEKFSITSTQAKVLGIIKAHKNSDICPKHLEEKFSLTAPSVTSLLNGLEKNGFIVRVAVKDDGRAKNIRTTPKGDAACESFLNIMREVEHNATKNLTAEEIAGFKQTIARMRAGLTEAYGEHAADCFKAARAPENNDCE